MADLYLGFSSDADNYDPKNYQWWRNLKHEVWRPVVGREGWYEISHTGNVRSANKLVINTLSRRTIYTSQPIMLRPDKRGQGYLNWNAQEGNGRYVHRAVAEAFIGPPIGDRREVDHLDGDAKNNCVWNLEWVTRAEQMRRAKERGVFDGRTNPNRTKSTNPKMGSHRLKKELFPAIRADLLRGLLTTEVAVKYDVSKTTIQDIRFGRLHRDPSLTYPLGQTGALAGRALSERMGSRGATGVRGVNMDHGLYRARIMLRGKSVALGSFKTLEEAVEARKAAEAKYWP